MHIVVPVKAFHLAKSRLTTSISAPIRARLAEALLVGVLQAAHAVRGVSGVVVVSRHRPPCLDTLGFSVGWLQEEGNSLSLNAALSAAADQLHAQGVRRILVLPSDLPCLQSEDVQRVVDSALREASRSEASVLLVPDKYLRGTNALATALPLAFPFFYGADSFHRHGTAAREAGCEVHIMHNVATACDLDDPCDLDHLGSLPVSLFSTPGLHALVAQWLDRKGTSLHPEHT